MSSNYRAWLITLLIIPSVSYAETFGGETLLHLNPLSTGTGESFRGNPRSHDNILFGPAILALEDQYGLDAFSWLTPKGWHGLGVSAVDSRTGPVTMGLSYRISREKAFQLDSAELPGWELVDTTDVGNLAYSHNIGAAVALSDRNRLFSFGLTGQRWWRSISALDREDGWRLGGSIAFKPTNVFAASFGGQADILSVGARGWEGSSWLDAGIAITPVESFGLYSDIVIPLPVYAPQIGVGARYSIMDTVPIQFGWVKEADNGQNYLTAGLGAYSPEMYIHYSLRIPVGGEGRVPSMTHGLGLGINF